MSDGISETFSKNQPRRRGRPRLIPDYLREFCYDGSGMYKKTATERTKQNVHYQMRAMGALFRDGDYDRFRWLVLATEATKRSDKRATILAELGRIEDDDDIREWAEILCEQKPKSRVAVAMIRQWRLGSKPGKAFDLQWELMARIEDYLTRHPETSTQVLERAVLETLEWVRDLRPA